MNSLSEIAKDIIKGMTKNPLYIVAWCYWGFFAGTGILAVKTLSSNPGAAGGFVVIALIFLALSEIVGVRADIRAIETEEDK